MALTGLDSEERRAGGTDPVENEAGGDRIPFAVWHWFATPEAATEALLFAAVGLTVLARRGGVRAVVVGLAAGESRRMSETERRSVAVLEGGWDAAFELRVGVKAAGAVERARRGERARSSSSLSSVMNEGTALRRGAD